MTHRASVWLGAGLGLLVLSWGAAPAVRAQTSPEAQACSVFAELNDEGLAFCLVEGCEPSEKDCQKLCRNGRRTCDRLTRDTAKLDDSIVDTRFKQRKTLCKTAADPRTCKSNAKEARRGSKAGIKQFRRDAKAACKSSDLVDECLDACNLGLSCTCVGPDLICDGGGR